MTVAGFAPIGVTVDRLVRDTLNHLRSENTQQLNKLDGDIDDEVTALTYTYTDIAILSGRTIEIDNELMYVWTANTTTMVLEVERGWQGTAAVSHDDGAVITTEPRFTRQQILDALRDEVESWPAQLYGILVWTDTDVVNGRSVIPLDDLDGYTGLRLLRATVERTGYTGAAQTTDIRNPVIMGAELETTIGDTGYPDGYALRFTTPEWTSITGNVVVILGAHFQTATLGGSVDVGTLGLVRSMCDIAAIGAAVRLLFPVEVDRSDSTALTRSRVAADVPPGAASQTAQAMLAWRDRRISEEILRLVSDFGWSER